jgi:hypothetical protein
MGNFLSLVINRGKDQNSKSASRDENPDLNVASLRRRVRYEFEEVGFRFCEHIQVLKTSLKNELTGRN